MSVISKLTFVTLALLGSLLFAHVASAQTQSQFQVEPSSYRIVTKTIMENKPVTQSRWVEETSYETESVTRQKPIWQTEKRIRETTVRKPVEITSLREERQIVRTPITTTKYRDKRTEVTGYEESTEYRDEEYTVRKPVIETRLREEQVTVRKKVTEDMIEVQNVTTYRPVTTKETQYVSGEAPVCLTQAAPDLNQRPRLRFLRAGNYTDPSTQQQVYRRGGFHWVQPTQNVSVASTVPVLIPQETEKTTMVPETTQRRRPVEISRYVDRVETRKVPVEVQRMIEETQTRRVPYTVRKPVTKVTVEQIPYTETTYEEEVVVKKVPVTETTYEEVTRREPYEVRVPRWTDITEEVRVPKTVRRRVDYEVIKEVPRTITMKIPLDVCGEPMGPAVPVNETGSRYDASSNSSTTYEPTLARESASSRQTTRRVDDASELSSEPVEIRYKGSWESPTDNFAPTKLTDETSGRSVLVPETRVSMDDPDIHLKPITANQRTASKSSTLNAEAPRPSAPTNENSQTGQRIETLRVARPEMSDAERQDIRDIANLPSRINDGSTDNEVTRAVRMPESTTFETGDEFAAERPVIVNQPR